MPASCNAALPTLQLRAWHGCAIAATILLTAFVAQAQGVAAGRPGVFAVLAQWTPLLLRGFIFNILISFFAMAIGTVLGAFLGIGLISLAPPVRGSSLAASPNSSATRRGSCCCSLSCSCCRSRSASAG